MYFEFTYLFGNLLKHQDYQLFSGCLDLLQINERDQPAAKECNRKLYYRQKLEKLFVCLRMGL